MTCSKEIIERIKSRVSIVEVARRLGVELSRQGKNYIGHCPFHEDRNPSLSVNAAKNVYHCFGCGAKGDEITFVRQFKGYSFQEAIAWLADMAGVDLGAGSRKPAPIPARSLSAATHSDGPEASSEKKPESKPAFTAREKQEALARVVELYSSNLAGSSQALSYLRESRGIRDNRVIQQFQIGFASGSLEKHTRTDARLLALLQEVGILNEHGREVFRGSLVFPVIMDHGIITELYARSIRESSRVKHLYLKGPHSGVFNYRAFKIYDSLILCEGIIDALSLFAHGFKNVSCLFGLNGLTEDIKTAIHENRIKKLYFAFDNEEKAKEKARACAEEFPSVIGKWIELPERVKDVNEYFAEKGYKADNFQELMLTSRLLHRPEGLPFDAEEKLTESFVDYCFTFEEYRIKVTGVPKKELRAPLKVGAAVRYLPSGQNQYESVDLFSIRSRRMFAKAAATQFEVGREDLDDHLIGIFDYVEKRNRERVEVREQEEEKKPEKLTEEEKKLGLKFLKSKNMLKEIVRDMSTLGYVGEDRNKLLAYLVATSRKMDNPLAAIIISRSSAGKSKLVDTVEQLIPPEEVLAITSASDQSLFYFKEGKLSHTLISMGEHHGMENIEYHIRELLSAKKITKVVSVKNEEGKIETVTRTVHGPIAYFMTSTNPDLNEENLSRCLRLYIDESEEQTQRILEYQRRERTVEGYTSPRLLGGIKKQHRIAQRMLENMLLRNNFTKLLDFPGRRLYARRDQKKFLYLMEVITFLHQYQREEQMMLLDGEEVRFIQVTLQDYDMAYDLFMNGILQNTLSDLPKMARDLHRGIIGLRKKVGEQQGRKEKDVLFTRKMLVDHTGFTFAQVRNYMRVLEEYEIVEVSGGYQNGRKKQYRLVEESIDTVDLSMIPSPYEIRKRMEGENKTKIT